MPIVITCASCASKLKAPDMAAGKKIKCPKCQGVIAVPASANGSSSDFTAVSTPPPPPPVLPPPPPREEVAEQEYYADDERPRKKKKKKKASGQGPNKTVAGLLALFLGAFGAHKFYLGYTGAALTMLLVTLLTCSLGGWVMGPIALIEAITYLTKSDEDFYRIYVKGQKPWF